MDMDTRNELITLLALKLGGFGALARRLGVSRVALYWWRKGGNMAGVSVAGLTNLALAEIPASELPDGLAYMSGSKTLRAKAGG